MSQKKDQDPVSPVPAPVSDPTEQSTRPELPPAVEPLAAKPPRRTDPAPLPVKTAGAPPAAPDAGAGADLNREGRDEEEEQDDVDELPSSSKPSCGGFKTRVPPDPLLGQVIQGRYRIDRRLGRGGMSVVYQAHQLSVHRDVAVKIMDAKDVDPVLVKRFFQEAQAASLLRSRHTIKVFDFGEAEDDFYYMVMELLTGISLEDALHQGPLAPERSVRLVRQICLSLREAHGAGIIHRDLKPANIYLEPSEEEPEIAKVLDFGIAKWHREGVSNLTMSGSFYGTPQYMSPEQCQSLPLDNRSDLYTLGVVFYEMVSGRKPFDMPNPASLVMAHVSQPPPALSEVAPQVPPALAQLIHRLLAKAPEDRPASTEELIQLLDGLSCCPAGSGATRVVGISGGEGGSPLLGDGLPSPQPATRSTPSPSQPAVEDLSQTVKTTDDEPLPEALPSQPPQPPKQPGRRWPYVLLPALLILLLGAGGVLWGRGQLTFLPPAPPQLRELVGAPAEVEPAAPDPSDARPGAVKIGAHGRPKSGLKEESPGSAAPGTGRPTPETVPLPIPDLPPIRMVKIRLESDPPAMVNFNDEKVVQTPAVVQYRYGQRPLSLVFTNTKYKEQSHQVVPDQDRTISVKLEPR